jgi:ornithine cyclodeaminase/alanine dehydrogenase-like protein (mu-crystallin family)
VGEVRSVTVLLTRPAIDGAVDVDRALRVLEDGFRAAPPGRAPLRMAAGLPGPGTAACLMPGTLPGIPAYTVKVNAKFPGACPALRGVVCLHDLDSGELLALADSAGITAWRTGLAAALATRLLASPSAQAPGFADAGARARVTAAGLRRLRGWRRTGAADLNRARAAALATDVVAGAAAVARAAEVIVLATWSRRPLLDARDPRPGRGRAVGRPARRLPRGGRRPRSCGGGRRAAPPGSRPAPSRPERSCAATGQPGRTPAGPLSARRPACRGRIWP